MERFTDSATGERLPKQLLGGCLCGRLILRSNRHSSFLDLYWSGSSPAYALDHGLKALMEASRTNLGLLTGRRLPPARALPVTGKLTWWWLARLAPGRYAIEERQYGGGDLFEILPVPERPCRWLERPRAAAARGPTSNVVFSRDALDYSAPRPDAKTPEIYSLVHPSARAQLDV
jgi:hypothetical protein